jgi:hypothetical protein
MTFLRAGSTSRRPPPDEPDIATDAPADEGHPRAIFLRGLSIGALVGAAIAGSTIWERRRGRRGRVPNGRDPEGRAGEPGPPSS